MRSVVIGIGEFDAVNEQGDVVKTFALGSCVSVILHCPRTLVMGMVHIALPSSNTDLKKAEVLPGYFADTGIPAMIRHMRKMGAVSPLRELKAKLAGGAAVINYSNNFFNIGQRNLVEVHKILESVRIEVIAEDTGGNISRTVYAEAGTNIVVLSSPAVGKWEI